MAYTRPQAILYQLYAESTSNENTPLYACIVGDHFDVHDYTDGADNAEILAGEYNPSANTDIAWSALGKSAGTDVDTDWTKVYIKDALLRFFNEADQAYALDLPNAITFPDITFVTANGYDRNPALERDVRVGDIAILKNQDTGDEITTTILGLSAATSLATIGTPSATAPPNDTESATITFTEGTSNNVTATADASAYDGLADGQPSEVYRIEVIQASTGGDATTALLKVTSVSGTDDVDVVQPAAWGSPTAIGTRGLTVTFSTSGGDEFIVGQVWTCDCSQDYTNPSVTSGGSYTGDNDKTYIIEVVTGGKWADTPMVRCYADDGSDANGPVAVSDGSPVNVGSQGVTITFSGGTGLCYGAKYTIAVEAAAPMEVNKLTCADTLSALNGASKVTIQLCERQSETMLVPERQVVDGGCQIYYQQNDSQITLNASWRLDDVDGEFSTKLPVVGGTVYIAHRDRRYDYTTRINSVDTDSVTSLGEITPDNPLAYGAYKAAANSGGMPVKVLAVSGDTVNDWQSAMEILSTEQNVHGIVPLTQERELIDVVVGHVNSLSDEGKGFWRAAWVSEAVPTVQSVYTELASGNPILVDFEDNPDQTGTQYTKVVCDDALFMTNGVKPGDILRSHYETDVCGVESYEEYVIDTVVSETELILASGPDSGTVTPIKAEVWRNLTSSEYASLAASYAGRYGSKPIRWIFPDTLGDAGTQVGAEFMCAALAGLRSGVSPHQPLTRVEISGFDSVGFPMTLTESQLDTIAGSGSWIVVQDENTGAIYTRDALTTDMSSVTTKYESAVANADELSRTYWSIADAYVGRANVSDSLLRQIETELLAAIKRYKNTPYDALVGPRILDGTILFIRVSETNRDHIEIGIENTIPVEAAKIFIYFTLS